MLFFSPWYLKIDSNQFINIKMIYNNLQSETSDVVPDEKSDVVAIH